MDVHSDISPALGASGVHVAGYGFGVLDDVRSVSDFGDSWLELACVRGVRKTPLSLILPASSSNLLSDWTNIGRDFILNDVVSPLGPIRLASYVG